MSRSVQTWAKMRKNTPKTGKNCQKQLKQPKTAETGQNMQQKKTGINGQKWAKEGKNGQK